MAIVIKKLKDATRPLKASYFEAEINFCYYQNRFTLEREQRLVEKQKALKQAAVLETGAGAGVSDMDVVEATAWVIDYIKEFVADWDVLQNEGDTKPAPITEVVLKQLPTELLAAMVRAINADQTPSPTNAPS